MGEHVERHDEEGDGLPKARLTRVSSRTRPAWGLLVRGSNPLWHTRRPATVGSSSMLGMTPSACNEKSRLGVRG